MLTSLWSVILKTRDHLLYLGRDVRITLKWSLMISDIKFGINSLG
jgi:hypothetical protein